MFLALPFGIILSFFLLLQGCTSHNPSLNSITQREYSGYLRLELGLLYLEQGNNVVAGRHFQRALEHLPRDHRAHLAMAVYAQKIGENNRAQQHYSEALQLAPKNSMLLNNYGAFLCQLGQYKKGINYLKTALAVSEHGLVEEIDKNLHYCYLQANN